MRVGEIAERAGVTVRTLHHYEAIGLLAPGRTPAGHRVYAPGDVERLLHITALRSLGLGLDAIRRTLDDDAFDPAALVARRRADLDAEVHQLRALAARLADLERLLHRRATDGTPIPPDTFLTLTKTMTDIEKHYTPEQLAQLAERRRQFSDDEIRAVEAEWPRLFEAVGAELDAGTAPTDPRVRALIDRWDELVAMFTGGDAGIERSLGSAVSETREGMSTMMGLASDRMQGLFAYAQQVREARESG